MHNLHLIMFFWKSCCLWDNVEKYYKVRLATDNNMAHMHYTGYFSLQINDQNTDFALQQRSHKYTSASPVKLSSLVCDDVNIIYVMQN